MNKPIPRLTRWIMWHSDDLALIGDRCVVAVCVIAIFLFAIGAIH